ncbi:hypothetical protein HDV00_007921 [Rhizophlyctis rosea]|nr:hypothetical protein HDV00_007921 [Rhizophlyctis rosea]
MKPHGTKLGPGLLPSGTKVRRLDLFGRDPPKPLDGIIVGKIMERNKKGLETGKVAYVIQNEYDQMLSKTIEYVHDERNQWRVKTGGEYVSVQKYLEMLG